MIPAIMVTDEVVNAKKEQKDFIPALDAYDLVVDVLTLLGNSAYTNFQLRDENLSSLKRRQPTNHCATNHSL